MIRKIFNRIRMVMSDRRWLVFYLQRRIMAPGRRRRIADWIASRLPPAAAPIVMEEARSAARELNDAGITMLGQLLAPQACEELRRYFSSKQVFDPYREGLPRFLPLEEGGRHPDAHIAHHAAIDVLKAPYLLALANDSRILDIVSQFLGCKPTIGYLAAWWSYATGKGAQQAEFFHRDVDDWRFVKLFIYLTDVGLESGPHVYVKSSSGADMLKEIRRFSDEEVVAAFGDDNVLRLTAASGHGFLEDTFGIHKGMPVESSHRLIFQAVYSYVPLPYGPLQPVTDWVEIPVRGLDPWINRVYVK